MYNLFAYRRDRESSKSVARAKAKSVRSEVIHSQKTEELRKLSVSRALEWTRKHVSKEFTEMLQSGAVVLVHPSHFENGTRSKDNSPNVYVRRYQLEKERIAAAESDYHNSHLNTSSDYDPKSPHSHTNWLRATDPSKFVVASRISFHPQDTKSRLNTAASKKRLTTLEGFNLNSALNPSFRVRTKAKEIASSDFNCFVPSTSTAFSTPKQYASGPYVDTMEGTVALLKKRDKSKDVSPKSFVATTREPWKDLISQGTSLREKKTLEHRKRLEMTSSVPNICHKTPTGASTANESSAAFAPKYYVKTYQTHITLAPISHLSPQASPARSPIKPSHTSQVSP